MQRYFFQTVIDGSYNVDEEGHEFDSFSAAHDFAIDGLRDIVAEAIRQGVPCDVYAIDIFDADGNMIKSVPLIEAIEITFSQLDDILKVQKETLKAVTHVRAGPLG